MSTQSVSSSDFHKTLIDERLDAIDQALVGLLPRQERLSWVGQIESRLCEFAASPSSAATPSANFSATNATLETPAQGGLSTVSIWNSAHQTARPIWPIATQQKKRSRLALSAAACGIAAMALLVGLPFTFLVLTMVSELLGEIVSLSILGIHVVSVGFLGCLAMALAVLALFSLRRRSEQLTGRGWAFTGLLTGPAPVMASIIAGILLAMEMGVTSITLSPSVADDVQVPTIRPFAAISQEDAPQPGELPAPSFNHGDDIVYYPAGPEFKLTRHSDPPVAESTADITPPNELRSGDLPENRPTNSAANPEQQIPASELEPSPIDAADMPESAPGI